MVPVKQNKINLHWFGKMEVQVRESKSKDGEGRGKVEDYTEMEEIEEK